MMTRVLAFLMVFALGGCAILRKQNETTAAWPKVCGNVPQVKNAKFCVYKTGPAPTKILYVFHGLADSNTMEESMFKHAGMNAVMSGLGDINIVFVTFGDFWMLKAFDDPKGEDAQITTMNFADKIIPYLETKYKLTGPRLAIGHSMGGSNLATLASVRPELFQRIAITNPMIIEEKVEPWADIITMVTRACLPCKAPRAVFTPKQWDLYNPHALLEKATAMPPTYVTACPSDIFKLFKGPQEYASRGTFRGFDFKWNPAQGKCNHFDYAHEPVLEFLKGAT